MSTEHSSLLNVSSCMQSNCECLNITAVHKNMEKAYYQHTKYIAEGAVATPGFKYFFTPTYNSVWINFLVILYGHLTK
jgi:hypothetical protein